jgi:hypothetical protein
VNFLRFLTIVPGTLIALAGVCLPATADTIPLTSHIVTQRALEDLFIPRRSLEKARLGINAFVNDPRFGSIRSQFREVRTNLGLRHVRVLFHWNDQIQSSPSATPFFGFYDAIINSLPPRTDALVIINGLPTWMKDSRNWTNGDPRATFIEKWVKPVVARYGKRSQIAGWQLWNEPNDTGNPDNSTLGFTSNPEQYLAFLASAANVAKDIAPTKIVVSGSTTAINQNYPATLNYNRSLIEGGLESLVDIIGVHFYGKSIERVLLPGGVGDFFQSLMRPVWITESGAKGITKQRDYAQRIFPFLFKNYPIIKRIYIYQFTDSSAPATSYGLRNLNSRSPVSDLYIYLRQLR